MAIHTRGANISYSLIRVPVHRPVLVLIEYVVGLMGGLILLLLHFIHHDQHHHEHVFRVVLDPDSDVLEIPIKE